MNKNKRMVIAGGSGFIGEFATTHFSNNGYSVTILSRNKPSWNSNYDWIKWDGKTTGQWTNCLENVDVLINLSGKSVNCRYSEINKQLLISSRINSTQILGESITKCQTPPRLWLNASSATIHSNSSKPVGEDEHQAEGFSPDLCRLWEKTLYESNTPNTRKVALRMGLVLNSSGSTMTYFKTLARLGLGGTLGTGKQHISWIHWQDFIQALEWIIDSPKLNGPINLVSPTPTENRIFMKTLRRVLSVPIGIPAKEWMVQIGAFILGTSSELILWDRNVVPKKLIRSEFKFKFPTIDKALGHLLS